MSFPRGRGFGQVSGNPPVTETYTLPQPAAAARGFTLGSLLLNCTIAKINSLTVNGVSQPVYLGTAPYNFRSAWNYYPGNNNLNAPNAAFNVPQFAPPPQTSPDPQEGDVVVITYTPQGPCVPPSVAQSPTVQPAPVPLSPVATPALPAQVQERAQWYVATVLNPSLVSGLVQNAQQLKTDSDAPFRLTAIALSVLSSTGVPQAAAGNIGVTIRFYRPDGSTGLQKHILSAQAVNPYDAAAVNGAGAMQAPYFSLPTPVNPNILFPAGSIISFDYAALAGITTGTVRVIFMGTKLGSPGQFWNGAYPAKVTTKRPFFGYTLQLSTGVLPLLDQPLQIQHDADFVLQTAVQTSYPVAALSPVGLLRGLGLKMKDWNGKYYMNDYVPLELIVGGFDYSQTPGIIYPEIYVPKNQALYFDLEQLA